MYLKNKRADISVTILVILTLNLCIFALISFHITNKNLGEQVKDYDILEDKLIEFNSREFLGNPLPLIGDVGYGREDSIIYQFTYLPYSNLYK